LLLIGFQAGQQCVAWRKGQPVARPVLVLRHIKGFSGVKPGLAQQGCRCGLVEFLAGRALGVGCHQQTEALELAFQTVVETFPVSEALGQLIAADLIQLLLLADQMQRKWQATVPGYLLLLFVQPLLGTAAVGNPA